LIQQKEFHEAAERAASLHLKSGGPNLEPYGVDINDFRRYVLTVCGVNYEMGAMFAAGIEIGMQLMKPVEAN
jgi:hypothetical protein